LSGGLRKLYPRFALRIIELCAFPPALQLVMLLWVCAGLIFVVGLMVRSRPPDNPRTHHSSPAAARGGQKPHSR